MPRLLLPLLLLTLTACADAGSQVGRDREPGASGSATPGASAPGSSSAPESSSAPDTDDEAYVGLTEEQALAKAEEAGVPARVVARNGESLPRTMDYRPERLGFTVVDGRVTAVGRG